MCKVQDAQNCKNNTTWAFAVLVLFAFESKKTFKEL
jgi:hypothetical protein